MPAPRFIYTGTQEKALERLVALGFCRPNSIASQAQIDLVWLHIPVEQSGGLGLGLHYKAIAAYVIKKAHTIIDKDAGMTRWHQWVADHNHDVPVPYVKQELTAGRRRFSKEDRKILQNLISLGICGVTQRQKIQVKHVWFEIPVEQLGGRGVGLDIKQVMDWVRRSYLQVEKSAGDEAASTAKWEKWISDHNHFVPPYKYPDGTWSREAQGPVGATDHDDSDSPLTDLSDLDVDSTSPTAVQHVLGKASSRPRALPVTAPTPAQTKWEQRSDKDNAMTPSTYHLRSRAALASRKKIRYTECSDHVSEHESSDDEITKTPPNIKVPSKSAQAKRVAPAQPPVKGKGNNVTTEKEMSTHATASYGLRTRTPLDHVRRGADVIQKESRNNNPPCDNPVADYTPTATDQRDSIVLEFPERAPATPCPQSRVAKEASIATPISAPEFNSQQRSALETLVRHGLFRLTQKAFQQIRDVWSKVAPVEGGGEGLNITRPQIQRYLAENGFDEREADEKQNALVRWEQWINKHRRPARLGPRESETPEAPTRSALTPGTRQCLVRETSKRALPATVENISQDGAAPSDGGSAATAAKTAVQHKGKERERYSGNPPVPIQFPTKSKVHYLSLLERGALETLMNHGLCRINKITEAQVENVWKKVPLKEGGGQELLISWKRITRFITTYRDRVPDKDESMRRWDKWVHDHRQQARDGVTPPRQIYGEPRSKRRRCSEDECTDEDNCHIGCESSVPPRGKRFKSSAIDSPSSTAPDRTDSRKNSPLIDDGTIPHAIHDSYLKSLYQPYLELTQEQINLLAHLVLLGGCWNTARDQHLIKKIWLRVPQRFGGGLGLGVPFQIIKAFAHSRGGKRFRTKERLKRWEHWIARNRSNVVVEDHMMQAVNEYTDVDAEGDTVMTDDNEGGNSTRLVAGGVTGVAGAKLATIEPALGILANQTRHLKGISRQPKDREGELMIQETPQAQIIDTNTHSIVSPSTENVHDVNNTTHVNASHLNRLPPPSTAIPQAASSAANTQAAIAHGTRFSSSYGNLESTAAQTLCYATAYQPRLSYSMIQHRPGTIDVQATDEASVHSPALQIAPRVVTAPPVSQQSISQAVADLSAQQTAQLTTAPRHPWLREDGTVRDWYWYPPGGPGGPGRRIFEHWSSSAVPLRQFDSLRTHEVTLTIGRDPNDIASVLRGLEHWQEVKQVKFHGYQPQTTFRGEN
ncbi:hypothetical protein L211DRAFT_865521 [Terfezia boudieri ATCC MYA-4762]|uniref:Uncharacterized protein n=1 Tax=Terfezia boudieri ATCC MYA-4762 TaxID=1051890 RepID=A0A3N4LZA3_9PEZI|nr:hypothetical protein L211DRAFT_865521 [Terfezia boudieri ATCC MYA-4762]